MPGICDSSSPCVPLPTPGGPTSKIDWNFCVVVAGQTRLFAPCGRIVSVLILSLRRQGCAFAINPAYKLLLFLSEKVFKDVEIQAFIVARGDERLLHFSVVGAHLL